MIPPLVTQCKAAMYLETSSFPETYGRGVTGIRYIRKWIRLDMCNGIRVNGMSFEGHSDIRELSVSCAVYMIRYSNGT